MNERDNMSASFDGALNSALQKDASQEDGKEER